MKKTFNIEEIKNYIITQTSFGDVLYNLNEQNINKANTFDIQEDEEEPIKFSYK